MLINVMDFALYDMHGMGSRNNLHLVGFLNIATQCQSLLF